jgi:putative membrane protein
MKKEPIIIRQAEFNERIRKYIFWVVLFYMFISVAGIPLIFLWVAGLGQFISRRYYERLECQLTETHLEYKKGVMFRVEKTISLENIQDLTFLDNPFLRWFDLRILKIETAGSSNPQGSDMKLIGIIDTPTFKEMVLEQRSVLRNKNLSESASSPATDEYEKTELLKEIRDLLAELVKKTD